MIAIKFSISHFQINVRLRSEEIRLFLIRVKEFICKWKQEIDLLKLSEVEKR